MMNSPRVAPWADSVAPTESRLRQIMAKEGLDPYPWSNGPHEVYSPHLHTYNKVIYVVQGSITFGLPESGEYFALNAGDRIDLPAGVVHEALVGAWGVVCLEGHKD